MSNPVLRVQLLGGFNLIYNGKPVPGVHSTRLQSLLAYLILFANAPQLRQYLAFLLWPDNSEAQARNNLRQFLYQLRQALPDSDRFLMTDASTVCWKTDSEQEIDVLHFGRSLNEAEAAEQRGSRQVCRYELEQAVSTYQGDLLPGCYDDWIAPERERLRQQYGKACQKLLSLLETEREYAEAIQIAQCLQRIDPLEEEVYVSLLRLHGLNADIGGAQRVYKTATEVLQRELGIEPGAALQAAYKRLQAVPRKTLLRENEVSTSAHRLIGRQAEWQQVQTAWHRAAGGEAHLCLIIGEAGIGKSRLAEELFGWAARQGFTTAYTRSYNMEGRLSLSPVTEWLRSEALRPHLASLDRIWLTELSRLLPELLSEHKALSPPEPITEYGRRQRFFEALARGVLAAPRPLLLWIDDLQWCDQETLEWLHFLLRFEPRNPILFLGTVRSDESPPDHPLAALTRQLQADNRVHIIALSPLDAAETAKLASQVQGHSLDEMATLRLYHETEGNPLFVVETVRAGMIPTSPIPPDARLASSSPDTPRLPPRVLAVIAGRLAQLSPAARTVAEVGAAMGCAFTLDLLLRVGNESEETIIHTLNELWLRRIVREQSANVFDFTHDKLREVTYSEISRPQRRLLHRRIAQSLESLHGEDLDAVSAQVAAHYEQAGLLEQAIPYYQRAGLVAAGVYANEDAIHLYNRGAELLGQLPVSPKLNVQELDIQLALATLYRISKGWTSPEEERVINRAMVLSDSVGDVKKRLLTLFGLQSLYVVQAQFEKVIQTYAETEELFKQTQGAPPLSAQIYVAGTHLHLGQIVEARKLFEKIVASHNDKPVLEWRGTQGPNHLVHGRAWNAHGLWCLGYPQAALNSAQEAIEIAHESPQPFNQAMATTYLAMLYVWQADTDTLLAQAENAYTLTREYKAPYYHAWATILLRFAQAEQQPDGNSLTRLRDAIHVFAETGAHIRLPVYFSLLAQACLKAGRWEEGLNALEQAWAESRQNNERWWDADIYRLRGELLWAQGADLSEVEAAFLHALHIARTQQARSLELRAATGLARLWQAASRPAEAKACLTQVVAWFTEGFDTLDLKAAQALIARL